MNELSVVEESEVLESADEASQYLSFVLGGEVYGVSILVIKEILEYSEPTIVPMMPEFIKGVVNLRGSVVPVVDLSLRLGQQPAELTKRTCIVIIEVEHEEEKMEVGVMVDAVNEVLDIEPTNIEETPNFGLNIRTDFISGMGKVAEKFVVLLNINKVLSVDELSLLDQAGSMGS